MRIYLTLFFLCISFTVFATVNRGSVDSIKNLLLSTLKEKATPDTVNINRLNKLAASYFDTNPDSTIYYGEKSIMLSRKINYKAGIADALLQTAHASFFEGRFEPARKDFDEAISIYSKLNDKSGLSRTYTLYARMYNLLAEYKLALGYLNQALTIDKQLKNDRNLADCLKNMGIVHYSEGQLSTALDYYFKALSIDITLKNNLAAASNDNDIGVVLQGLELYPKALEYFNKAQKMFQSGNDLQGVGIVNENIGEVFLSQGIYDHAISYLDKSIKIAIKQEDQEGISSVYTDLGLCYAKKNNIKLAISYLNASLNVASKYKIVYNEAGTLIGFATVYNLQKDYKKAYKYAVEGQKLATKLGNLKVRADAALQLNKTLAGLNEFESAYQILRQFNDLKDSLHNNESIQKLTSLNLELKFNERQRQLKQQEHEKDELYKQSIDQQRFIIAIALLVILGTITISVVYYQQKRKQQKVNLMLEEKNREVLEQKTNLDDQAQKLNDLNTLKDRLISVLAHDLRAPLSTLRGLFSLLQDETISHEQMLDMIPGVLKKLEYTSDFLDTLLFWINSQMENFENSVKNFHIKNISAFETEAYQEQAASKGIKLIDNVPGDLVALADPNSVRIVIRNLITNAIKFSKENDIVEIIATRHNVDNLIITVSDTGTGMTEEQAGKLFKSKVNSKTGTNNETGTGMGLLFCKDLVEKCNGKIWVTSKQGEGTKFSFTVPVGVLIENTIELVNQ